LKIRHLMILKDAKREINKLMLKGLDKPDVALLVLSWGTLSAEDMEEAAWYLHEWKDKSVSISDIINRVEELERDK
jgi:hypothetical protein